MSGRLQSSGAAPPQPSYILRGHSSQIHALNFHRHNLRLLSGDAEGWLIDWNIVQKRPAAVWRAHGGSIIGLGTWGSERIITHGRDNKLHVWQLREEDEASLSRTLPVEGFSEDGQKPWLLHSLQVNALNFCSFAMCTFSTATASDGILVAVPGVNDGTVSVTSLPSEERFATIPAPPGVKTGMLMAVRLHVDTGPRRVYVVAGYEAGSIAVFANTTTGQWETLYAHTTHTQPVLSLDIAPGLNCFFSSSADAIVARHQLGTADSPSAAQERFLLKTKHAGQQSLVVRSDEKVFATAGWDGRARVYSTGRATGEIKELAVLKWHKEGVYAVDFASVDVGDVESDADAAEASNGSRTVIRLNDSLTVAQRREKQASETHWLAIGGKDGKVSLWNIY